MQQAPASMHGLDEVRGPQRQQGKLGWIALWLIGIPLPVLFVLYLIFG